jgi:hypothetical protein
MEHQKRRKKQKKKFVRFSSQDHFLRTCAVLLRPHVERNDDFSSWKSLFFYRCTDTILFAPLKSQPGRRVYGPTEPRVQVQKGKMDVPGGEWGLSPPPPEMEQEEETETDSERPGEDHTPVEPMKAEEMAVLWEKEESRADHIRENTVAAAPPPCSPKTIYVLANLVRQSSTERPARDTNTPHQARNSAPLL